MSACVPTGWRSQAGRELLRFSALVAGSTALFHGALVLFGEPFSLELSSFGLYLYLAGLAAPTVAALVVTGRGSRGSFVRTVLAGRAPWSVYLSAVFAQIAIVAIAWIAASRSLSLPRIDPAPHFALLAIGQVWVSLGEEPGWRGFALPRLESLFSPRLATLVIAAAWGVWHLPMFFVPGSWQAGTSPWLFAASILCWSAIHSALYRRAGPSVLPNLIFHGCANLTLQLGFAPAELHPFLFATYLLVGAAVWASLRKGGDRPTG